MAGRKLRSKRGLLIAAAAATLAAATGIVLLTGSGAAAQSAGATLSTVDLPTECAAPAGGHPVTQAAPDGGVSTMSTPPFPTRAWTSAINTEQQLRSGGEGLVRGTAHFKLPFFTYYAQLDAMTSCAAWVGDAAATPDSITLTDRWHVDFVGTPLFPVGAPADAKIVADGGTVDVAYTTTVSGAAYATHSTPAFGIFPNAEHSYSGVYHVSHEVTAVFQFGSQSFTVTGNDRSFTG